MGDSVGQQLGNYRLTQVLGRGGFAEVYLGEHKYLKTQAAVKVLQTKVVNDEELEYFLKEAQIIARLTHPHIIRILDFGVDRETPFLVMDYASNGTLRQLYPRGSILPLSTIVPSIKQVADALQYAHDEKVIHRDIKPENMLLGRSNNVLLSDFGIALITRTTNYQSAQDVIGTVAYMSPEQIQGKPQRASDQYSLGIVVYEWLCGDRPFHGNFTELCVQHMFAPPPPLREKVPTLSPQVEQVVMTALSKDATQRFKSVQAFANALAQASVQDDSATPNIHVSSPPSTETTPPLASSQPLSSGTTAIESKQKQRKEVKEPAKKSNILDVDIQQILSRGLRASATFGGGKVWKLTRQQLGITILGILLYAILSHSLIFIHDSYQVILVASLIPLFFGAISGPWVGLLTGGLGFFIGNYVSSFIGISDSCSMAVCYGFNFHTDSSVSGFWIFSSALIGFIAGLTVLFTGGSYKKILSLVIADVIGGVGIALCFIISIITSSGLRGFERFYDGVFFYPLTIVFCLVVLPILLFLYTKFFSQRSDIDGNINQSVGIWGVGRSQIIAIVIGVALCSSINHWSMTYSDSNFLSLVLVVVAVFMGTAFGSWSGFLTIGISFLVITCIPILGGSGLEQFYWLNIALISSISGIALPITKGRYTIVRNMGTALLFSIGGISTGFYLINYNNLQTLGNTSFWQLAPLPLIVNVILLPILLFAYTALTNRNKQNTSSQNV